MPTSKTRNPRINTFPTLAKVVVKTLDDVEFNTRANFLEDPIKLAKDFDALDKYTLGQNSIFGWLKSLVMPDKSN